STPWAAPPRGSARRRKPPASRRSCATPIPRRWTGSPRVRSEARMSARTFAVADAVELAVVERAGFIESRHAGSAVLLDPTGTPALALGAIDEPVLVRSTLKPLQAIASMRLGADLQGEAAALATASHRAEQRHID